MDFTYLVIFKFVLPIVVLIISVLNFLLIRYMIWPEYYDPGHWPKGDKLGMRVVCSAVSLILLIVAVAITEQSYKYRPNVCLKIPHLTVKLED